MGDSSDTSGMMGIIGADGGAFLPKPSLPTNFGIPKGNDPRRRVEDEAVALDGPGIGRSSSGGVGVMEAGGWKRTLPGAATYGNVRDFPTTLCALGCPISLLEVRSRLNVAPFILLALVVLWPIRPVDIGSVLPSWRIHIGKSCGASRAALTAAFTVSTSESDGAPPVGMIGFGEDLGASTDEGLWTRGFVSVRTKSTSSGGFGSALGDMVAMASDMEGMTAVAERGDELRMAGELPDGGERGSAMLWGSMGVASVAVFESPVSSVMMISGGLGGGGWGVELSSSGSSSVSVCRILSVTTGGG